MNQFAGIPTRHLFNELTRRLADAAELAAKTDRPATAELFAKRRDWIRNIGAQLREFVPTWTDGGETPREGSD